MQNQSSKPELSVPEQSVQPADPWNELAELAAMTGYKVEPPPGKSNNTKAVESLLDDEDLEDFEANSKTKIPLWSNPLAKTALVSALMATGLGSVGLFIWSLNGNWNKNLADSKPEAIDSEATPKPNSDQAEISRLKTVTALGSQAQIIKQAPKTPARFLPSPDKSKPAKPPTQVARTPSVSPAVVERNPTVVTPPAPSYTPVRQMISPAERLPEFARPVASPVSPAQPTDPDEAWQKALAVGSYGQSSDRTIASAAQPMPTRDQSTQLVDDNPRSQEEAIPVPQEPTVVRTVSDNQQLRYETDEQALLSGIPRHTVSITPGAIATARLMTPIVWAQDLKAEQQPQRFVLQSSQPIYGTDGSVALPVGSQIVAKVDAVSNSGMMQLSIVQAVVPTSNGNQVIEIPAGTMFIAGEGGQPLVAKNHSPQGGEVAKRDIAIALMGALGQVGSLLNRPSNQTTTTSPYLSTTSISNGQSNLLGGILEGGFGKLADRISQRQQQQVEEILQRPNFWYVPAGQSLQIFIAAPVEVTR
ncbi:TrbI/VirB10 family protein [Leptolyngbya sp. AN03gr2]|uniref:TrbI/VirB10 family protein n=1 Tax=unclassified Leptolyngbya TaxID=2650499 RepID=UPI003D313F2E